MNERILTNKNHGMRALVLWILAFVASIFLCVIGSSLVDTFGGSHVEGALGGIPSGAGDPVGQLQLDFSMRPEGA